MSSTIVRAGNQIAKKPDEEKKIKKFWIMCTEKEKGLYVKASRDEGMTLSAWIRGLCNKEIQRIKKRRRGVKEFGFIETAPKGESFGYFSNYKYRVIGCLGNVTHHTNDLKDAEQWLDKCRKRYDHNSQQNK